MLKIGIIGSDIMAQSYVEAFRKITTVQPVACFDSPLETTKEFAKANHLVAEPSYEQVLNQCEMIYIGNVVPDLKKEVMMTAVDLDKKFIICEPPFPFTEKEAQLLIAEVNRKGIHFAISFTGRFKNPLRQFRYQLTSGRIGNAVHYWSHICDEWKSELLLRYLQEEIDLIRWIGGEIIQTIAQGTQIPAASEPKRALSVIFYLKNGSKASLMINWDLSLKLVRRGLIGKDGTVIIEQKGLSLFEQMRFQLASSNSEQVVKFTDADMLDSGILEMVRLLLGEAIGDKTPVADLVDGAKAATISQQILEELGFTTGN